MTDNPEKLEAFESRLRSLRPAPLSEQARCRLMAACPAPRRSRSLWVSLAWAAGLTLFLGSLWLGAMKGREGTTATVASKAGSVTPAPSPELKDTTDWVLGCREVAIWHSPDGVPYRVLQWLTVQQSTWKDPVSGKQVVIAEPKQRVVLLAMDSQ